MIRKIAIAAALVGLFAANPAVAAVSRTDVDSGEAPGGGAQDYLDKVAAKRAKYGNDDGVPHARLINGNHVAFTVGLMNWVQEPFADGVSAGGPAFGLDLVSTFNDYVGVNAWGSFGAVGASAGATIGGFGASYKYNLSRTDLGVGVRIQTVIPMGSPQQGFVPFVNLGPTYTMINSSTETTAGSVTTTVTNNSNSAGFYAAPGVALVLGGASIAFKFNYMVSSTIDSNNTGNNTGVMVPQLEAGWAF